MARYIEEYKKVSPIMFLNLASFLGMRWKQDLRGSVWVNEVFQTNTFFS